MNFVEALFFASASSTDSPLITLATVVVVAIGAQWVAWRIRVPAILLLLTLGLVFGPLTGHWLLNPDSLLKPSVLFPLVSLAVAIILFEGGLSLHLKELQDTAHVIRNLCTIGALLTWALTTLAAYLLLEVGFAAALILGSLLVVTGPTVVGPMLRHIRPTGRVGAIAKWEGIVIDPIGAMFAVLALASIEQVELYGVGGVTTAVATGLLKTIFWGGLSGLFGAWITIFSLRRYWIPDHLQSPVLLMLVVACFTAANYFQPEAGLLAVTMMGVILGNQKRVTVRHIVVFKENLRVLLISLLFVVLAARIRAEDLSSLGWGSLAFVAVLMLVVRPVSVYVSTLGAGLTWRERVFLSWLAPRGIVAAALASVFALALDGIAQELAGAGKSLAVIAPGAAAKLTPVTFLVIIFTVAIYGLTAAPLARRLGLASAHPQGVIFAGADPVARALARALQAAGFRVLLVDSNRDTVQVARMEGIPTFYASIISEAVLEEADLGGIGRLLAMTHNDEVNSLAAWHFSEVFGRSEVYQLMPESEGPTRTETADELIRGRRLFNQSVTFNYLEQRLQAGAVVKTTKLTDEFDYATFRSLYGASAVVLCVTADEVLKVNTVDTPLEPKPGETVIALVDTGDEES